MLSIERYVLSMLLTPRLLDLESLDIDNFCGFWETFSLSDSMVYDSLEAEGKIWWVLNSLTVFENCI